MFSTHQGSGMKGGRVILRIGGMYGRSRCKVRVAISYILLVILNCRNYHNYHVVTPDSKCDLKFINEREMIEYYVTKMMLSRHQATPDSCSVVSLSIIVNYIYVVIILIYIWVKVGGYN